MTLRVKVRQGGAVGSTTRDYSGMIPLWYGYDFSAGMQFGGMTANQSSFTIIDIDNLIRTTGSYQVNAHNVVWITEDGPGYEAWLHRGRVARKDFGRGIYRANVARTVTVVTEDGNVDLRGLALVEPWVRGAETGTNRVIALGTAFLSGSPRLTTNITVSRTHLVKPHPIDGEVMMPAKTYEAGTDLPDIIRDCAETEGQEVGVVIHHQALSSHLCLLWCEEDDWTAYPAPISISDQLSEVNNTTVFEPHWKQGSALQEDGQEVLSGIVSKYGTEEGAYVVFHSPANAEKNDYWVEEMQDATSVTVAQATTRAGHLRAGRANEHRTTQVSLILPASMVDRICAGMSISIEASAARAEESLGASVTRRIASLKWEPKSPEGGEVEPLYWAHMQLDRPKKIARTQRGVVAHKTDVPKPPSAGSPEITNPPTVKWSWSFTSGLDDDQLGVLTWSGSAAEYLAPGCRFGWTGNSTVNGFGNVTPRVAAATDYQVVINVDARTGGGTRALSIDWLNSANAGLRTDLLHANLPAGNHVFSPPSTPAGTVGFRINCAPPGLVDNSMVVSYVELQTAGAVQPAVPGDTTTPVGGTGTGTVGTDGGTYSPIDHAHEHGNITTGGPYHMAEDVTFAPTGTIAATTVQTAIAEVASEASGGMSNPMTTVGDIIKGGTAGAAERLAIGTSGQVLKVVSGAPAWAAESGGGGGGVSWTQDISESGASFANFTADAGTWASDGTIITQSDNGLARKQARYATQTAWGFGSIVEAELRLPATGQGAGANVRLGFHLGTNVTMGTNSLVVYLNRGNNTIGVERETATLLRSIAQTINLDQWYKLRVVAVHHAISIYLDGVLLGSARVASFDWVADYFTLYSYGSIAHFRNVKVWTLSGGAPA